jgi:hypothetical protein
LLKQENDHLKVIHETWIRTDSIRKMQLISQQKIMDRQTKDIEKMKKDLNITATVCGTAVGVTLIAILCVALK